MTEVSEKARYVAPELIELGTFEQLTQHGATGADWDATFGAIAGDPANHDVFGS